MKFYAEENKVKITGRTIFRDQIRYLGYSATSISFQFTGKIATATLISDPDNWPEENHAWVAIYINDSAEPSKRIELTKNQQTIPLYENETENTVTITIMKYSEPEYAICGVESITIDTDKLLPPPEQRQRKIQIIGDSITCGYGIEGSVNDMVHNTSTENPSKAYSVLISKMLNADLEIVAWNGKGVISSYIGDDQDTPEPSWLLPMLYQYTDAGCCHQYFHEAKEDWEKWDSKKFIPNLVIVFLGTNDASYTREIPERNQEFCVGYQNLLLDIHTRYPDAKILCMLGTMDSRLCPTVEEAVDAFASHHPETAISYLALPHQQDEDGLGTFWHPTPATHQKIAALVTRRAREMMGWD